MQIDLQSPMVLLKAEWQNKDLVIEHDGNAHYILFEEPQKVGDLQNITLYYSGKPKEAVRPPWDGGITWSKDGNGRPFVASSCQGLGASIWWPCKDHMYDEPDSMLISVNVPQGLMDVSNGRLRKVETHKDKSKTYHWFVNNPISNYGVNINIADYVHFSEKFKGELGNLDLDYYVLKENLPIAKKQFQEVPRMMKAFEHWFGPYPFYEDGYKLVEVPYLGMEHQSSITYGNGYENGYHGTDLSGTGWGLKFDFIIVHESGHEWFANNITYKDVADMWVHEGFTNYSENLFVEYYFGKEAGADYVIGTRKNISNNQPIIGLYDVNFEGSTDMYYKGGNLLHLIRQLVNNDEQWRNILRGLNKTFYHQTVTTQEIESYIIEQSSLDLQPVFDQYLRDVRIPVLEYYYREGKLFFRWNNTVNYFRMPVKIYIDDRSTILQATDNWNAITIQSDKPEIKIDRNYYVAGMSIN